MSYIKITVKENQNTSFEIKKSDTLYGIIKYHIAKPMFDSNKVQSIYESIVFYLPQIQWDVVSLQLQADDTAGHRVVSGPGFTDQLANSWPRQLVCQCRTDDEQTAFHQLLVTQDQLRFLFVYLLRLAQRLQSIHVVLPHILQLLQSIFLLQDI